MTPKGNIETLNALPISKFRTRFWPSNIHIEPAHDNLSWRLTLDASSSMPPQDLNVCYQLIYNTSSKQYATSSLGWYPMRKRREMRLPDLKYVQLRQEWGPKCPMGHWGPTEGFMSFMLTYEDGIEVIYLYEIHLQPEHRGKGLGKCLVGHMEEVGRKAGVKKAMLTVFKANQAGMAFYERLGYEEDEYSPRPRKLRGGVFKEPDYIILSKSLVDERQVLKPGSESPQHESLALKR